MTPRRFEDVASAILARNRADEEAEERRERGRPTPSIARVAWLEKPLPPWWNDPISPPPRKHPQPVNGDENERQTGHELA
jgi:hypothetical protein